MIQKNKFTVLMSLILCGHSIFATNIEFAIKSDVHKACESIGATLKLSEAEIKFGLKLFSKDSVNHNVNVIAENREQERIIKEKLLSIYQNHDPKLRFLPIMGVEYPLNEEQFENLLEDVLRSFATDNDNAIKEVHTFFQKRALAPVADIVASSVSKVVCEPPKSSSVTSAMATKANERSTIVKTHSIGLPKTPPIFIPKRLHYIWLGGAPYEDEEQNVLGWIKNNPDFQVVIWLSDSDLLEREILCTMRNNNNKHFLEFVKNQKLTKNLVKLYFQETFAKNNANVQILDMNTFLEEIKSMSEWEVFSYIREDTHILIKSIHRKLHGRYKNLAAASDMLRVLLLFYRGGIYFDFDIDSKSKSFNLELLKLNHEMLANIHMSNDGVPLGINNDMMASVARSKRMAKIISQIARNQNEFLDTDSPLLVSGPVACRNALFGSGFSSYYEMRDFPKFPQDFFGRAEGDRSRWDH